MYGLKYRKENCHCEPVLKLVWQSPLVGVEPGDSCTGALAQNDSSFLILFFSHQSPLAPREEFGKRLVFPGSSGYNGSQNQG